MQLVSWFHVRLYRKTVPRVYGPRNQPAKSRNRKAKVERTSLKVERSSPKVEQTALKVDPEVGNALVALS